MGNGFSNAYYLVSVFLVIVIFFLAYYATVFIAKKSNKYLQNKHIKVLEKTTLGLNLSILVIQIHNKVYVLLQYQKEIELLDVIDKEEWNEQLDLNSINNTINGQTLDGVNRIKKMFRPKSSDIKGENNKNRNE